MKTHNVRYVSALSLVLILTLQLECKAAVTSQSGTWDLRALAPKSGSYATLDACAAAADSATAPETDAEYLCETTTLVAVTASWQVKKINDQTTRSAYTFINGVVGNREVARATIGTPCDDSRPSLLVTPYAWMHYDASAYVTLCWQQ